MKSIAIVVAGAISGIMLMSGCSSTGSNAAWGHRISDISTNPITVNAHMERTGPVTGQAELTTYEVLWFTFTGGDKYIGALPQNELWPNNLTFLEQLHDRLSLVYPPVDRRAALWQAYYNAIENSNSDYLINTRAKVETTGFNVLGIFGIGHATATVNAQGLSLAGGYARTDLSK